MIIAAIETKGAHLHYGKKNVSRNSSWTCDISLQQSLHKGLVRKALKSLSSILAFSALKQKLPSQPPPQRKQQLQVECTRLNEIFLARFLLLSPLSPIIRQQIIVKNTRLKHNYPWACWRTHKSANVTNKPSPPLQNTSALQMKA